MELFLPLEIEGYVVREYHEDDVAALRRHADDPEVWRQLGDAFPHPYTETDALSWLDTVAKQDPTTCFAISSPREFCGGIGVTLPTDPSFAHDAEIGYWLGRSHWNRGVATAAVGAFTAWAQTNFGLRRLTARVFAGNPASLRVLAKCGYVQEGTMRQAARKHERYLDLHIFGWLAGGIR